MTHLTSEKRLWSVRVVGEYGPKPKLAWWTLLLEAATSDEAMALGVAAMDAMAPSDRRWNSFEARSAATAQLPMIIEENVGKVKS